MYVVRIFDEIWYILVYDKLGLNYAELYVGYVNSVIFKYKYNINIWWETVLVIFFGIDKYGRIFVNFMKVWNVLRYFMVN